MNLTLKTTIAKYVVSFGVIAMFGQMFFPAKAFALTAGPSQPEQQAFMPINATEMVDPFTGSFSYNLPLLEVPGPHGGYPINIFYAGPPTMEQEASCVGLGWQLNLGNISRTLRGLPDDFRGHDETSPNQIADKVKETNYIKPDWTISGTFGRQKKEICGIPASGPNLSTGNTFRWGGLNLSYNSYHKFGIGTSINGSLSFIESLFGLNAALDFDSHTGVGITGGGNLAFTLSKSVNLGISGGIGINSREGIQSYSYGFNGQLSKEETVYAIEGSGSIKSAVKRRSLGIYSTNIVSVNQPFSIRTFPGRKSYSIGIDVSLGRYSLVPFGFKSLRPLNIQGFFSSSWIGDQVQEIPAYGYFYTQYSNNSTDLLDFSRSKDPIVTRYTRNLSVPSFNYDYFQINGHGVGGTFRPFIPKHGLLSDRKISSTSSGASVEFELGGNFAPLPFTSSHLGGSLNYSIGKTESGPWSENENSFRNSHTIDGQGLAQDPLYEPVYFKIQGEHSVDQYDDYGNMTISELAERVKLEKSSILRFDNTSSIEAEDDLVDENENNVLNPFTVREHRVKRNTLVSTLSATETKEVGVSRYLYTQGANHPFLTYQRDHHHAEFTVTNPTGIRYVYGYPVYNGLHKEVQFSHDHVRSTEMGDTVTNPNFFTEGPYYLTGENYIDGAKVKNGINNEFFHETQMDPYARDYLLNAIVGTNYIDVDRNGPDEGDLGYWVRLDYDKTVSGYKWRAPYQNSNFTLGVRNERDPNLNDDQGFYSYGTKDLAYVSRVETETHFAVLSYSNRKDGFEAANEFATFTDPLPDPTAQGNPNVASKSLQKLDYIELYSKVEPSKPLLKVHFEYDYELCQGVKNNSQEVELVNGVNINQGGKLTLKKVWFTYLDNQVRGRLTPYSFEYATNGNNYNYPASEYDFNSDNWGNYKPPFSNSSPHGGTNSPNVANNNLDYPFVDQTTPKPEMDKFMSAWALDKIHLPSGSIINIEWEAKDYSYVQDQKAAQLVNIVGLGSLNDSDISHTSSTELSPGEERIYIQLHEPMSSSNFIEQYMNGLDHIFFRVYMKLNGDAGAGKKYPPGYSGADVYDYVTGYCEIHPGTAGVVNNFGDIGYFDVKKVQLARKKTNKEIHPFTATGIQYTRLNRPDLVLDPFNSTQNQGVGKQIGKLFQSFLGGLRELVTNYNSTAIKRKGCQKLYLPKSFVRLNAPHWRDAQGSLVHSKFGGGARVKKLTITGTWNRNNSNSSPDIEQIEYGQSFDYTTTDDAGNAISSGVATNEPWMSPDENPLQRFREGYEEKRWLTGISNVMYTEEPVMASYYPAPQVGYSKVTIRSINDVQAAEENQTGRTEYEFFTARDFPVKVSETPLEAVPSPSRFWLPLLGSHQRTEWTFSQGYSIVLNNMAGKVKSVTTYPTIGGDDGEYISKTEYQYYVDSNNDKELDNNVNILTNDGLIRSAIIGRDVDQFTTMRQEKSEATTAGIQANFSIYYLTLLSAIPVPCFLGYPSLNRQISTLKTATTVKVVQEYGILKSTTTYYKQSHVKMNNLLFDAETGVPLLTSITNNFDNPVYTYNYAAHWFYPGMQPAYQNIGYEKKNVSISGSNGSYSMSILSPEISIFQPGDELLVSNGSQSIVMTVNTVSNGQLDLYSLDTPPAGPNTIKIIRSGHRNLQATPVGQIISLSPPPFICGEWFMLKYINLLLAEVAKSGLGSGKFFRMSAYEVGGTDPDPFLEEFFNQISAQTGLNVSTIEMTIDSNGKLIVKVFYQDSTPCVIEVQLNAALLQNPDGLTAEYSQLSPRKLRIFNSNGDEQIEDWANISQGPCDDAQFASCDGVLHAEAVTFTDDWSLDFADGNQGVLLDQNGTNPTISSNPYESGERGIYRPNKNFAYHVNRNQVSLSQSQLNVAPNLAQEGIYESFSPFPWLNPSQKVDNWVRSKLVTKVSPAGHVLESYNALDISSCALFGYGHTLPIMTAANADYLEIANLNFEDVVDYPISNQGLNNNQYQNHFGHFYFNQDNTISAEEAYTGAYSLKIGLEVLNQGGGAHTLTTVESHHIALQLKEDKSYTISCWVKEKDNENVPTGISLDVFALPIINSGSGSTIGSPHHHLTVSAPAVPNGPSLEGWQRLEYTFTIPTGVSLAALKLSFNCEQTTGFIDDIRILPADAEASTFVYDPYTKRYEAQLDDQNLAARYFYDDAGSPTHIMKDTERGTKLIQEYNANVAH